VCARVSNTLNFRYEPTQLISPEDCISLALRGPVFLETGCKYCRIYRSLSLGRTVTFLLSARRTIYSPNICSKRSTNLALLEVSTLVLHAPRQHWIHLRNWPSNCIIYEKRRKEKLRERWQEKNENKKHHE